MASSNHPEMKLRGRFTLYGEYLMHDVVEGYAAPVTTYLRSTSTDSLLGGYNRARDTVRTKFISLGLRPSPTIEGSLAFGQGFASSTVLALLHCGNQIEGERRKILVEASDRSQHGFSPSGVDFSCVSRQYPIFYGGRQTRPAPYLKDPLTFACILNGGRKSISSVLECRQAILSARSRLVPLATDLTASIESSASVDLVSLKEYSRCLLQIGCYSVAQARFVEAGLRLGLAVKGIGAVKDCALVIAGDPDLVANFLASRADVRFLCERYFPLNGY